MPVVADRRDVPEESDGDHRASRAWRSSRTSRASRSRSAPRATRRSGRGSSRSTASPTTRSVRTASRVQPFLVDTDAVAAGLRDLRAVLDREGRRRSRSCSCSPTWAIRPTPQVLVVTRDTLAQARRRAHALRARVGRRLEELPRQSGARQRAHPQGQPADGRRAARVRRCARCASTRSSTAATRSTAGLLTMTDARWKATVDFLRSAGLAKAGVDYAKAWTLDIVQRRAACCPDAPTAVRAHEPAPVVAIAGAEQDLRATARGRSRRSTSRSRAGEFVTLLGPSGCGKTTLLDLIAGLIAPTAGRCAGGAAPCAPAAIPGAGSAIVFQSPTLMPWARVAANVRLPLDLAGVAAPPSGRGGARRARARRARGLRAALSARALRRHADARVDRARARHRRRRCC